MTDWDNDGANGDASGEEIIELTDMVMDEPDFLAEDEIIELTDIVKDEGADLNLELPSSFAPTSEQLEAALEKVIEKQFADKIQTILFQVVERVIEREITEIRESLQKDLDQIENA
ncbi:MAG: hypothetical protein A3J85_01940 [Desulfobacula sp. RIFOXYA12_FULL_46_16]|nr:MAG: hypothetical protein A3J85_01940 [Desulfobacula sp. RIFOXYA12_FULL_46_16]OGR61766.1 MAG: hypothetical protein A3J80_00495 [Desulfobacula sp. RIFOXYB2_FULL_45_6]